MVKIDTGDSDKFFKLDGNNYRKGLYELYYTLQSDAIDNRIGIRHINRDEILVSPTQPSLFNINNTQYSSATVMQLIIALGDVLGFNTGGGGSAEADTLTSVTNRGNTTNNNINSLGTISATNLSIKSSVDPTVTGTLSGELFDNRQYILPDLSGMVIIDTDLVNNYIKPAIVVTAATTYTVENTSFNPYKTLILTLNGTSTTVTLPLISASVGRIFHITNIGTGDSTLNSAGADGSAIWEGGSLTVSSTIPAGTIRTIINDGLKYRVFQ